MSKYKDERGERLKFFKEQIESTKYLGKKKTKVIWDGRQFSIRIPKKFADLVGVKKGDLFLVEIQIPPHDSKEESKLEIKWLGK